MLGLMLYVFAFYFLSLVFPLSFPCSSSYPSLPTVPPFSPNPVLSTPTPTLKRTRDVLTLHPVRRRPLRRRLPHVIQLRAVLPVRG